MRERLPSVVKVSLHRSRRHLEDVGDLRDRAIIEVEEGDDLCLTTGKPPHDSPELRVSRSQIWKLGALTEGGARHRLRLGGSPPERRDREVRDHAANPGTGLFVAGDLLPVPVRGEERLLCKILGAGTAAGEGVGESHNGCVLPSVELLERLRRSLDLWARPLQHEPAPRRRGGTSSPSRVTRVKGIRG